MALDPTFGEPLSAGPGESQPPPENPYPLDLLGRQIKAHWREHRPKMYRALEEAGELDKAVYEAQERTHDALSELVQKGWDWNQAWEALRQEWAFLPSEEDEDEENHPQPDPVMLIERFERRREAKVDPPSNLRLSCEGSPFPQTAQARHEGQLRIPGRLKAALVWIAFLGALAWFFAARMPQGEHLRLPPTGRQCAEVELRAQEEDWWRVAPADERRLLNECMLLGIEGRVERLIEKLESEANW